MAEQECADFADLITELVASIPDGLLPDGDEALEGVGLDLAAWLGDRAEAAGLDGAALAAALAALWPWSETEAAGEAAGFVAYWPEAA